MWSEFGGESSGEGAEEGFGGGVGSEEGCGD